MGYILNIVHYRHITQVIIHLILRPHSPPNLNHPRQQYTPQPNGQPSPQYAPRSYESYPPNDPDRPRSPQGIYV